MSNTKRFERQQPGSKRMIPVPISYIFVVLIFPYSKYCHLFTDIHIKKKLDLTSFLKGGCLVTFYSDFITVLNTLSGRFSGTEFLIRTLTTCERSFSHDSG